MKTKQIIGLVIAVALFILTGISSVLTRSFSENFITSTISDISLEEETELTTPVEDYIAIVEVTGTIQEQTETTMFETVTGYRHNDTMEYINSLMDDSSNVAILLYVDSPGGAVYESEELYNKLMEYTNTTGRPIWTYMAHYGASGGYMVALPSERIYANKNTVTGSIGVIMSGYDLSGLYEKLGIRYISIASGENKDSSMMTDSQLSIYQAQVEEAYASFTQKVADGRNLSMEEVLVLADGRTYTATQAIENGLIDEICSYEELCEEMCQEFDVTEMYTPSYTFDFITSLFANINSIIPKSEAQILLETADDLESGVLMYYAE